MSSPLLHIKNLTLGFSIDNNFKETLKNIDFQLFKNEILGIVGESGSGKSLTSLAVLGLLPASAKITNGEIIFQENNLLPFSAKEFRKIRGGEISMIFQEPMSSLNPSMKCGPQVSEILLEHHQLTKKEAKAETLCLFKKVKLPRPESIYEVYPHQISGGQKQRVMIAMAIACKPKILIADEPTTALDVTVQKEILLLLKSLQQETEMSIIFISHDLALVSEISDRVVVIYQGEIVEQNSAAELFLQPKETYTQALLASKPSTTERLKKLPTVKNFLENTISKEVETKTEREKRHQKIYGKEPLLEVINVEKEFVSNPGLFQQKTSVKAVNDVSFKIYEGETLGLVGESGCGKSTLGNVILQLDKATAGKVFYHGRDITKISTSELRKLRKEIQLIFQDPFSSLNPRIPVGKAIMEPMEVHNLHKNNKERKKKTLELLKRVGLDETHFNRYPHEFSGGQRQRIGIARTIAVEPQLIVCDESVSALDISVQAQVLNLLNELKENFGFTYIFISHDLAVVKYMADQLLVMNQGKIVEQGDADEIYAHPEKEYTQKLIDAIPKGI
ncbi:MULTISPECIES: ABC transporter ATP-binding protein [Mesonia]|uniref:Glutathione import ATP-binding protein GsiA n=1 Tax=Mesonia oceanica TaxID=2687242 RepID=A0AC61Y4U5_9FLAO|nr:MULTISPECIES: ABC transporter ATP-binding protein [Mesonia]MAN28643.1 ABC transporter ATP-binding protein [Mesonia sp.]MAQ41324.1 ABC transporter ATP-binding protein [Mesonia sp.]MBJ97423.1 ABC transporter ATP-binding protein [Flavobacteriaceae bacterium]VVU98897.1 Glutathione import ATP-binding protein GsiA [Mesonia oceanica]|tara:strand:+ start:36054 stop:37739 length:1686 start_codon:yes stop_codon:yes gene_type:complete